MTVLHQLSPCLIATEVVATRATAPQQGQNLPPALASLYQHHLKALQENVQAGRIFDGSVVALRGWHLDGNQLHLALQSSSYVPMTATRLTYVDALKSGLLREQDIPEIPASLGACLCACIAVITSDNQVLTLRRAARLSNPGTLSLGMGEILEPTDFEPGRHSLHRAGARALREELGVSLTPEQTEQYVKPLYLARGEDCGTWVFIIAIDLREAGHAFTAERILGQAATAKDSWESDLRQAIPFTRPSLSDFLTTNAGRLGLWAPQLAQYLLTHFSPA